MPDCSKLFIDPAWFRDASIADDTKAANAALEAALAKAPKLYDLDINVVRNALRNGEGPLAAEPLDQNANWRQIESNGLKVRLREFAVDAPRAVYLHMHQGGFSFGAADFQDQTLRKLSADLGVAILSVEYRLAPENPWPAPADDCEAAALWLVENAKAEFGTDCLLIGGESAGAFFALTSLIRLRDKQAAKAFAGGYFAYGPYDNSLGPALRNWGDRSLVLDTKTCAYFGELLWPVDRWSLEDRRNGAISPLFAQLHDLPPALFVCGSLDPMIDDTLFMATRWLTAGNQTELSVYPGGAHLFDRLPIRIAREAQEELRAYIGARIDSYFDRNSG